MGLNNHYLLHVSCLQVSLSGCVSAMRRGVSGLAAARGSGPLPAHILGELTVTHMQLAELL